MFDTNDGNIVDTLRICLFLNIRSFDGMSEGEGRGTTVSKHMNEPGVTAAQPRDITRDHRRLIHIFRVTYPVYGVFFYRGEWV